jgi:hypothetical protein
MCDAPFGCPGECLVGSEKLFVCPCLSYQLLEHKYWMIVHATTVISWGGCDNDNGGDTLMTQSVMQDITTFVGATVTGVFTSDS